MRIDFGQRTFLTHFELVLLVNGVRAAITEDRYVDVVLVGTEPCLSQVAIVTRWTRREDPREDVVREEVVSDVNSSHG